MKNAIDASKLLNYTVIIFHLTQIDNQKKFFSLTDEHQTISLLKFWNISHFFLALGLCPQILA